MLIKLLFINIGIFIIIRIAALLVAIFGSSQFLFMEWISVPASFDTLFTKPWTLLTYMFVHYDFTHILFNMLWFYWFGKIFIEHFTQKHLVALYIYGGLGGALLFVAMSNIIPTLHYSIPSSYLIGASASVFAIVTVAAFRAPDYPINLLFIGTVSLKWVAITAILMVVLSADVNNIGGQVAHIGGIATGAIFWYLYKAGTDISKPLNRAIDSISTFFSNLRHSANMFKSERKVKQPKAAESSNNSPKATPAEMAEMDKILEKIKRSGYSALTEDEKDKLFNVSKKA